MYFFSKPNYFAALRCEIKVIITVIIGSIPRAVFNIYIYICFYKLFMYRF